jgi:hypothetical protein
MSLCIETMSGGIESQQMEVVDCTVFFVNLRAVPKLSSSSMC